jgi:hypothetical protein
MIISLMTPSDRGVPAGHDSLPVLYFFYEKGDHAAQHANDGLLHPTLPMIVCF